MTRIMLVYKRGIMERRGIMIGGTRRQKSRRNF